MAQPLYSIIIPAYNEEVLLKGTLDSIKSAMSTINDCGEIIVVDNNSTDKTADIAESSGARVVFEAHNQISHARNAGGRHAKGKYLLFVDADTHINSSILETTLSNLARNDCCGGGAGMEFDSEIATLPKLTLSLWLWISKTFELAAGSYIYCTKEGFDSTGGFAKRIYAGEDVLFSMKLKKWGKAKKKSFRIIDEAVVTSSRKFHEYTKLELSLLFLIILIPFSVFSRRLSCFWYKRK